MKDSTYMTTAAPTKPEVEEIKTETENSEDNPKKPLATLLSSISYENLEDYNKFLNNLTLEHAVIVLIAAATHAQGKGAYTIEEAELIAKSITKLSVKPEVNSIDKN
ncbi:MAG: hypothetical protein JHC73_12710 [Dolichospermum sp.]|nr:hypothetical protein [Dolichospermum sp.]